MVQSVILYNYFYNTLPLAEPGVNRKSATQVEK